MTTYYPQTREEEQWLQMNDEVAGGPNPRYNAELDRITSHGDGCKCRIGMPDMLTDSMCSLFARVDELVTVLRLILTEPHGCPMCDSGKLRDPAKEHWDACGFARAVAVLKRNDEASKVGAVGQTTNDPI